MHLDLSYGPLALKKEETTATNNVLFNERYQLMKWNVAFCFSLSFITNQHMPMFFTEQRQSLTIIISLNARKK